MSYILDALKKTEYEKNRIVHSDVKFSISDELFHDRKQPTTKMGVWKVMLLLVAASMITGAGTWFALRGKSGMVHTATNLSVLPLAVSVVSATANNPVRLQPTKAVLPAKSAVVTATTHKPQLIRIDNRKLSSKKFDLNQSVQIIQAPADIKLLGVAWQDDRASRRAIINGFLLKEGSVVSGAKITDIKVDRVRFLSPSGIFEVKLDAGLPAEVPR
jgi:hypothetical protein